MNVNQRTEDFLPEVRPIAVSLAQELGRPVRGRSWRWRSFGHWTGCTPDFRTTKRSIWPGTGADCLTPGNQVQLITPVSREEAFALEIDDQFRLVVEYPDGRRAALSAGEVSVRGMYGYV